MKTVVITGSARGFALCQAKKFKELGCNVVLSDVHEENLKKAAQGLESIGPDGTKAIWNSLSVFRFSDKGVAPSGFSDGAVSLNGSDSFFDQQ